jgi:hypothetical protein
MRDLLYFVIGILLGLICILFDGSAVMTQSTSTATGIPRFGRLRPRIRRPPRWAVETPIDPASAGRATIAVVGTPSHSQKGWPFGRHVLDEPRGHASGAGQEDQRHLSANRQEHRRLDVDKSGALQGWSGTAKPWSRMPLQRNGAAAKTRSLKRLPAGSTLVCR